MISFYKKLILQSPVDKRDVLEPDEEERSALV